MTDRQSPSSSPSPLLPSAPLSEKEIETLLDIYEIYGTEFNFATNACPECGAYGQGTKRLIIEPCGHVKCIPCAASSQSCRQCPPENFQSRRDDVHHSCCEVAAPSYVIVNHLANQGTVSYQNGSASENCESDQSRMEFSPAQCSGTPYARSDTLCGVVDFYGSHRASNRDPILSRNSVGSSKCSPAPVSELDGTETEAKLPDLRAQTDSLLKSKRLDSKSHAYDSKELYRRSDHSSCHISFPTSTLSELSSISNGDGPAVDLSKPNNINGPSSQINSTKKDDLTFINSSWSKKSKNKRGIAEAQPAKAKKPGNKSNNAKKDAFVAVPMSEQQNVTGLRRSYKRNVSATTANNSKSKSLHQLDVGEFPPMSSVLKPISTNVRSSYSKNVIDNSKTTPDVPSKNSSTLNTSEQSKPDSLESGSLINNTAKKDSPAFGSTPTVATISTNQASVAMGSWRFTKSTLSTSKTNGVFNESILSSSTADEVYNESTPASTSRGSNISLDSEGLAIPPVPAPTLSSSSDACSASTSETKTKTKRKRQAIVIPNYINVIQGNPIKYECTLCSSKEFKTKSQIKYHLFCDKSKKPFKCEKCGDEFIAKSHYEGHLRKHTGERPFKCQECGKGFFYSGKVTRHMRSHTGEKPYVCDLCEKGFASPQNLQTHKLIHTGEKPFKCTVKGCNKAFTERTNLKKHRVTHTGERPYKCTTCEKAFGLKWTLDLHVKTHSTYRLYACSHPNCIKSFSTKTDLKRHILIHSGIKPYGCWFCEVHFVRRDYLYRHILKTHAQPKELAKQLADEAAEIYLRNRNQPKSQWQYSSTVISNIVQNLTHKVAESFGTVQHLPQKEVLIPKTYSNRGKKSFRRRSSTSAVSTPTSQPISTRLECERM